MRFLKFKKSVNTGKPKAPNKKMNNLAPGIEEFENDYLRCEELIDYAEKESKWAKGTAGSAADPKIRITDVHVLDGKTDLHQTLVRNYFSAARTYIKEYSGCQVSDLEPLRVARYGVDGHYAVHTDARDGNRVLSSVLYLNDNFEGGELYFPRFDVTYKPKAGSLLLFPSNYPYEHGSKPVTQGKKYCVLAWYRP